MDLIRPLGGLPAADRTSLVKPPLELVIAEVRFVPSVEMITDEQALAVQRFVQASGFVIPKLQPAQEANVEVSVAPGQPTTATQAVLPRLATDGSRSTDACHRHARSSCYSDGSV